MFIRIDIVMTGTSKMAAGFRSGPFDPQSLGRMAHHVIADLAAGPERDPGLEEILSAISAQPAVRSARGPLRQSARMWLCGVSATYFRMFAPSPAWRLFATELPLPGCRLDLAWTDDAGRTWADELKTGKAPQLTLGAGLDAQVDRQLRAGDAEFGDAFLGVRVLMLAAPSMSFVRTHAAIIPALDWTVPHV